MDIILYTLVALVVINHLMARGVCVYVLSLKLVGPLSFCR